jgi:hypothetical protein
LAEDTKAPTPATGSASKTTGTTTDDGPKLKKDIVPAEYRKRYAETGGGCGDFIAAELTSMMESGGIDSLNTVKGENNIPSAKWSGLNNGQQRMNLSNTLRASFLRGETITIAGKQHNLTALRDEFGNLDPVDRKSVDKFLNFIQMPVNDRNAAAIKRVFHDLPEKARQRAEREDQREKAKQEKEAKKAADAKAKQDAAKTAGATEGKGKGGGKTTTATKTPAKETEPA